MPALAWLGADAGWGPLLDGLVARASATPDEVRALRRALDAFLGDPDGADGPSLEGLAQRLGTTARTLQRRLKAEGTTFRRELAAAQVRAAERWLRDTDEPVSRIAYEVGCATPQHLSTLFKRATGLTPTAYRARERG